MASFTTNHERIPEKRNFWRNHPRSGAERVDADALADALRRGTSAEVRFDTGSRAMYSTAAGNYRQVPIGVVIPKNVNDVIETVALCREFGAPVLSRGGGTSLAGQSCNVAVVLDFSKHLNRLLDLDPDRKLARVEPGMILDDLRTPAQQKYKLTFPPDPATHNHCTIGGMIGNNSCGIHSVKGGKTVDNIEALEVLTYDGLRMWVGPTPPDQFDAIVRAGGRRAEIYTRMKQLIDRCADKVRERYPKIPRRVSGYNLDELLPESGFNVARALVGTEGTCVTVLQALCNLRYSPPVNSLVVLGYEDIYAAAEHVPEVLSYDPDALEGIDDKLINDMRVKGLHVDDIHYLPEGKGWLLVEFGGESKDEADEKARSMMAKLAKSTRAPSMKLYDDKEQEWHVWEIRESGLGATANIPGKHATWEGWEDSAVPPDKLSSYLRELRKLLDKYGLEGDFYGHFGQGCLHTRQNYDLATDAGIKRYRGYVTEAAHLVVKYGGSLSGEHGDGQSRAELLPIMYGEDLVEEFRNFKRIWDPDWKMNPGKVVDPYRLDDNLRLGADYAPPTPETHFKFPNDHGTFADAALRCVGVGKCRRTEDGTMCPSFMVTREEMHSTRGRARMLYEMFQGDPLTGKWRDEHVREALDLCLSCKGCKGDCPVNVDMATYKAEFLSHYYKGRMRPLAAYAMGLIHWWARAASKAPWLANLVMHTPGLDSALKLMGGIAPERAMPEFADETFRHWFLKRPIVNPSSPKVMLWPDTFNDHFYPQTLKSAVHVLEAAGYRVTIPRQHLCCGRPLYDYGMLDLARHLLLRNLDALRVELTEGTPIVGLEPSCIAVFRDEMNEMLPADAMVTKMAEQTFMLSEFLEKKVENYQPPKLKRKAIVQGHCHHVAIMKLNAERKLMKSMGLDYEVLDSGCCGMAGSFGFERDHYDISMRIGERALLPAVRDAADDTLIIADGFSCRTQIKQGTGRTALNLAEVMDLALRAEEVKPKPGHRAPRKIGGRVARAALIGAVPIGIAAAAVMLANGNSATIRKTARRAMRSAGLR